MTEQENVKRLMFAVHEEEKASPPDVLDAIMEKLDELTKSHGLLKDTCEKHFFDEEAFKAQIAGAFPGGDMAGHRIYHETLIEQARARREFWRKMTFELTKWGLIGFVGWLLLQAWIGLLKGPK